MTRFIKYIKENKNWFDEVQKYCRPYLNMLNNNNIKTPFFRGMKSTDEWFKRPVRKDRQPRETDIDVYKTINNYYEDMGHVPRDRAVITSPKYKWAKFFARLAGGNVYSIFPIGSFDFSFVPTYDFNSLYDNSNISTDLFNYLSRGYYEDDDQLDDILDELGELTNTNKNISLAHKNGYEVWFGCDEYYAINAPDEEKSKQLLSMLLS